ncbi:MAG: hypothetical protein V1723_03755 [Candidatus Uhrbacteria bacterium]
MARRQGNRQRVRGSGEPGTKFTREEDVVFRRCVVGFFEPRTPPRFKGTLSAFITALQKQFSGEHPAVFARRGPIERRLREIIRAGGLRCERSNDRLITAMELFDPRKVRNIRRRNLARHPRVQPDVVAARRAAILEKIAMHEGGKTNVTNTVYADQLVASHDERLRGLSSAMITSRLQDLERLGLVVFARLPGSRMGKCATITPSGRAWLEKYRPRNSRAFFYQRHAPALVHPTEAPPATPAASHDAPDIARPMTIADAVVVALYEASPAQVEMNDELHVRVCAIAKKRRDRGSVRSALVDLRHAGLVTRLLPIRGMRGSLYALTPTGQLRATQLCPLSNADAPRSAADDALAAAATPPTDSDTPAALRAIDEDIRRMTDENNGLVTELDEAERAAADARRRIDENQSRITRLEAVRTNVAAAYGPAAEKPPPNAPSASS